MVAVGDRGQRVAVGDRGERVAVGDGGERVAVGDRGERVAVGDSTRDRLIRTAERLLAEHGIDGVSLREITRESGARNVRAIQYHFTDRGGLIRAVLGRHTADVDVARGELLDRWEADDRDGLRGLAGALVRPWAAKLTDADGGAEFLQIYADALTRPDPLLDLARIGEPGTSLHRWRTLIEPLLDADAVRLHRRFMAILHTITELARRARAEREGDHRLFVSSLVDNVTAILAAPPSDETRSLLRRPR